MIDWPLALTTASHALKLAQDLRGIDKQFDQAELKLKIADLMSALADVKITLSEAKTESDTKDRELEKLKAFHRRVKDDMIEIRGYLYRQKDGKPVGHAFCPVCFQKEALLFELKDTRSPGMPDQCPSCKMLYDNISAFQEE